MAEQRTRKGAAPLRALIAGLLACVVLLHGFAALHAPHAATRTNGASVATRATTIIRSVCAPEKSGGSRVDHAQACTLCCGGRDWTAPPARSPQADVGSRTLSARPSRAAIDRPAGSLAPQSGWASSWSSRAPPAFS